jgi:hypothetical protein
MAKYAASAKARTPATVCTWERYVVSDENAWVKSPKSGDSGTAHWRSTVN